MQHGDSLAHSISPGVSHGIAVGGTISGVLFVLLAVYFAATATRNPLTVVLLTAGTFIIVGVAWLLYHGLP
jgi:hypothetical protein